MWNNLVVWKKSVIFATDLKTKYLLTLKTFTIMECINDIINNLSSEYRFSQYGEYYSKGGSCVNEKFFRMSKLVRVSFGETYYMEYKGVLCQCRLREITMLLDDFSMVFDVAYNGSVVSVEWGKVHINGGFGSNYQHIYSSVLNCKQKISVATFYASPISLFNAITDYRYSGYYSGGAGIKGYNYIQSYEWNGVKAVSKKPMVMELMENHFTITKDAIFIGYKKLDSRLVNLRDLKYIYTSANECEKFNEIVVSTFDDVPSEETFVEVNINIKISKEKADLISQILGE